ncbi:MAG TPA: DUF5818 domain-containing protein [Terriglobales bacterium]|nr:DUF5818 domain-containing protein [Terriglobales bacterium]
MNGKTSILVTLAFLLCLAQAGFAQNPGTAPDSNLGGQLIAWSELQNPQPMPQPRPDPAPLPEEQQQQQPDRQPPDRQQPDRQQPGQPVNTDAQQQSSAQTVTGTIVKEDGRYVLKASDHKTYQIDDQEKAKQFEGKQVKIVGSLDMSTGTIRIQSIEPAS